MQTLPNGLRVFNGTPHPITFWREDWPTPVSVPTDAKIDAVPQEQPVDCFVPYEGEDSENIWRVRTVFVANEEGREIIRQAKEAGAEVIVGSIIAAQAYPGKVCAMIPAPGYERVPPQEKRMRPDKFTIF